MKDTLRSEQSRPAGELPPDETLVARAREGDLEAMDQLVSRHLGGVFRAALGILGDEDAASDAAQETFLKAFRKLDGFRGDASFKTWVLAIYRYVIFTEGWRDWQGAFFNERTIFTFL